LDQAAIRRRLVRWYEQNQRDLPWRRSSDPYAIWVSEIMLQQTRVAAVIPYYQRFLDRFPRVEDLAQASEAEVLKLWSGLGYYSRARNLQKAARQIADAGGFPRDYSSIRAWETTPPPPWQASPSVCPMPRLMETCGAWSCVSQVTVPLILER
jgi:A/G-specific adenine glycosylase